MKATLVCQHLIFHAFEEEKIRKCLLEIHTPSENKFSENRLSENNLSENMLSKDMLSENELKEKE